jgi:hypothetical protein
MNSHNPPEERNPAKITQPGNHSKSDSRDAKGADSTPARNVDATVANSFAQALKHSFILAAKTVR